MMLNIGRTLSHWLEASWWRTSSDNRCHGAILHWMWQSVQPGQWWHLHPLAAPAGRMHSLLAAQPTCNNSTASAMWSMLGSEAACLHWVSSSGHAWTSVRR